LKAQLLRLLSLFTPDAWLGFAGEVLGAGLGAVLTVIAALWGLRRQFRLDRRRRVLEEGLEKVLVQVRYVRSFAYRCYEKREVQVATTCAKYEELLSAVAWSGQVQFYCEREPLPWLTRIVLRIPLVGTRIVGQEKRCAWKACELYVWLGALVELFWLLTKEKRSELCPKCLDHMKTASEFAGVVANYVEELLAVLEARPGTFPRALSDLHRRARKCYKNVACIEVK